MKDRILFIGIGQCGGNIVSLFESIGYHSMYINTSSADLNSINGKIKYQIPASMGCGKDRNRAINFAKNSYNDIRKLIDNKFSTQDIIYIVFSASGGTGSGISPILIDILSTFNPNKQYNVICVMPSVKESIRCLSNTVETVEQLQEIESLQSAIFLNNNSRPNKLNINAEFLDLFDRVVNMTIEDQRGIIDMVDLEKLICCKGSSIILNLDELDNDNSIFFKSQGCKFLGITSIDEYDDSLLNSYGMPEDIFKGYNDDYNLAILTGFEYPIEYINQLSIIIEEYKNNKNKPSIEEIKVNKIEKLDQKPQKKVIKEIDIDALLKKYS